MINLTNADFLQNAVNNAYGQLSQPLQSLATGSKVSGPSENPSDYFLAQSLLTQINGTHQAETNVQEGTDMGQTASGGMSNALGALQTMNSLAVQSGDGTLTSSDRNNINMEFQQMGAAVSDIAQNTEFNGTQLLNGSASSVNIQSGSGAGNKVSVPTGNITPGNLSLSGASTVTQAQSESAISTVQNAMQQVSSQQASAGAAQAGLSSAAANLANSAVNTASALSQVSDADFASELTSAASAKVKLQASIYALSTANKEKGQILNLLA
ncbi:MAG: hypothetical protein HQL08_10320 [Nitrospirae bacterium]|nr:hypothetical protein [Nitrospirota bacterium]